MADKVLTPGLAWPASPRFPSRFCRVDGRSARDPRSEFRPARAFVSFKFVGPLQQFMPLIYVPLLCYPRALQLGTKLISALLVQTNCHIC